MDAIGRDVCSQCDTKYKVVATHWNQSSCEYQSFTDHQRDIITGLMMGDGSINRVNHNPHLTVNMISPNYLEYIEEQFGIFGNGVSLSITAEENAKHSRESGASPDAHVENYSDLYRWRSMSHPELREFAGWYSTGEKVWPSSIELTPTVLRHWYCGDGHWNNRGGQNRIGISMSNEANNTGKVDTMFESAGLPSPSNYNTSEGCKAQFTVEQSRELWDYMGKPLPDFEYKWPEEYRRT